MSASPRHFASDNAAGVHPEVLAAIAAANGGHALAYGADRWTSEVGALFRREFGEEATAYLVHGGTGANVVGLGALLRPWEGVLCAATAHINVDECGAPERFLGCKLVPIPTGDGKLTPALLEAVAVAPSDDHAAHHVVPRVISISQSSEYGTVYRVEELQALAAFARARGLLLHLDGARLANAAASLGTSLRALSADVGVDVLTFGGTKNGALGAEAVVFFDGARDAAVRFGRKQAMQLPSKMRFMAAQFDALLRDGLWRRNAEHANRMASRLAEGAGTIRGVTITQPVEANAVFARLPQEKIEELQRRRMFHVWDQATGEVRWMCSFDTTAGDVDAFIGEVRSVMQPS